MDFESSAFADAINAVCGPTATGMVVDRALSSLIGQPRKGRNGLITRDEAIKFLRSAWIEENLGDLPEALA